VDATATAYLGLTLATFCWAAAFIAGKVTLAEMTPLPVAAWRFVLAAGMLLPFALRQRPAAAIRRAAGPLAVMVVCGGVGYPWLFLQALAHTSATNTSLLIALNPVFTLLLSPMIGERLDRRRVVGVLLALSGAVIVISHGHVERLTGLALNRGDLCAVLAAMTWATFNVASHGAVAQLAPSVANTVVYVLGGIVLFALGWNEHPWTQLAAATPGALGGIVVMGVLSSVMAGQFFLVGVRTVGVTRTVVFVYLAPVLTAALAALLLDEQFALAQGVGGAAVLAGVYLTTRA
jgi:drug/metabolite transporter (DMT)-like permease